MASAQVPTIGCRLSLISRNGIRYEGTLHMIDQESSSIHLANVKLFGTEGRGSNNVAPQDKVWPLIIFKAQDIGDLKVIESSVSGSAPVLPTTPSLTPTPMAASASSAGPSSSNPNLSPSPSSVSGQFNPFLSGPSPLPQPVPTPVPALPQSSHSSSAASSSQPSAASSTLPPVGLMNSVPAPVFTPSTTPIPAVSSGSGSGSGPASAPNAGSSSFHSNGANSARRGRPAGPEIPDQEFDFVAANAKLDKDQIISELQSQGVTGKAGRLDGFFDTISSDALNKLVDPRGRMNRDDRSRQRTVDYETFGTVDRGHRGGGRGGGRGGRGNHRGGYRSDYHQNSGSGNGGMNNSSTNNNGPNFSGNSNSINNNSNYSGQYNNQNAGANYPRAQESDGSGSDNRPGNRGGFRGGRGGFRGGRGGFSAAPVS
eukprot:ANDGO_07884.mRNA.1 Protein decapping 5